MLLLPFKGSYSRSFPRFPFGNLTKGIIQRCHYLFRRREALLFRFKYSAQEHNPKTTQSVCERRVKKKKFRQTHLFNLLCLFVSFFDPVRALYLRRPAMSGVQFDRAQIRTQVDAFATDRLKPHCNSSLKVIVRRRDDYVSVLLCRLACACELTCNHLQACLDDPPNAGLYTSLHSQTCVS